jgi:hypothetical protein
MTETARIVVGLASLSVSFKACIDLFDHFYAAKKLNHDYAILVTKLGIEKTLLLQWSKQSGLIKAIRCSDSDNHEVFQSASPIIDAIRSILSDGQKFRDRYGL